MRRYKRMLSIIIIICLIILFIPLIGMGYYTVLSADDFSHANVIKYYEISNPFILNGSIEFSKRMYFNWQGTYFAMFMQSFISPLNWGMSLSVREIMVLNSVLFLIAFFSFVYVYIKQIKLDYFLFLVVMLLISIPLFSYSVYNEVFNWYSGAISYSVPMSVVLIGLCCVLLFNNNNNRLLLCISCGLGLVGMGGSLTVAALGCFWCLLIVISYCDFNNKRKVIANSIICVCWIIGAVFNAMAPGNYYRHSVETSSELKVVNALINAIRACAHRITFYIEETNYISIIIALFTCGLILAKKDYIITKRYIVISLIYCLSPIAVMFPVTLGFGNAGIPNRCMFVLDIAIILPTTNLVIVGGGRVVEKIKLKDINSIILSCCIMSIVLFLTEGQWLSDSPTKHILKEMVDGTCKKYYQECNGLYNQLFAAEAGTDYIIAKNSFPQNIDYFYSINLSEDNEAWINVAVANYYNLKSVTVR